MNNNTIIMHESIELMKAGLIGTTGRSYKFSYKKNGETITETIQEPEPIHTYADWKALGFYVKKGEKAITSFMIWNYSTKSKKNEEEEGSNAGYYYMKKAAFFKQSQVEKIGTTEEAKQPEPEPAREPEPVKEEKPEATKKGTRKNGPQKAYEYIVKQAKKNNCPIKSGSYKGTAYATDGIIAIKTTAAVADDLENIKSVEFIDKIMKSSKEYDKTGNISISSKELKEGIKELKAGKRNTKVVYTTAEGITLNADFLYNALIATEATAYKYSNNKCPIYLEGSEAEFIICPINTQGDALPEGLAIIK